MLPYAIVEGMSGSAAPTYHNGPKIDELAYGGQTRRVVTRKVMRQQPASVRKLSKQAGVDGANLAQLSNGRPKPSQAKLEATFS